MLNANKKLERVILGKSVCVLAARAQRLRKPCSLWLFIPALSSSFSNGPTTTPLTNRRICSDTSSIDHLVMREFVSGPPGYRLAIRGIRKQLVVVEQRRGASS